MFFLRLGEGSLRFGKGLLRLGEAYGLLWPTCGLFVASFGAYFGVVIWLVMDLHVGHFVGISYATLDLEGYGCYYLTL